MTPQRDTNPWKGLNFYKEGEHLYGRDKEIESLSLYIINNTQTVLYGKSGIGKSSILNAGIFPIARAQGLFPIGIKFIHSNERTYMEQLREKIEQELAQHGAERHELLPALDARTETLWEYMHRNLFYDKNGRRVRLLLVFDQFEEIFTLQQSERVKKAFFDELADLLNNITPLYIVEAQHKDTPTEEIAVKTELTGDLDHMELDLDDLDIDLSIGNEKGSDTPGYLENADFHVVFTLREDFLSYLERYTAYIPVMKSNRYALLPLNEEQAADIIMLPQKGLVSLEVAELIIQKVTGRNDFTLDDIPEIDVDSAVLSLYLSRLYTKRPTDDAPITATLVNQFSADIIKDFYEESISDIPAKTIETIEDKLITTDGRRNNVSRSDLISMGVPGEVLDELVYAKKLLRQFSYGGDIRVEYMHDILCPVVDQRISQREMAAQQAAERQRQEAEKQALLRKQQEELARMEEEARHTRRKNRRRLTLAGILIASIVTVVVATWLLRYYPYSVSYGNFTTKDGWPVGMGKKLGDKDKHQMVVYYTLTRDGWMPQFHLFGYKLGKPFHLVEIMNSQGHLSTNKLVESPLVSLDETENSKDEAAQSFAQMQINTAYWRFAADYEGNITRQTAYDKEGKELYAIQYFRSNDQEAAQSDTKPTTLWMNYIDAEGKALRVRGNGADRMRLKLTNGYVTGYRFFSEQGTPQTNSREAFGYDYVLGDDNQIAAIIPLDAYGDSIRGASLHFTEWDKYMRWIAAGNATARYTTDSVIYTMPNRTDTLVYDKQGRQTYRSQASPRQWRTFSYNERGLLTEECVYRLTAGSPILSDRRTCTYFDDSEELKEEMYYNRHEMMPYKRTSYNKKGNTRTVSYFAGQQPDHLMPVNSDTNASRLCHEVVTTDEQQDSLTLRTQTYLQYMALTGEKVEVYREEVTLNAAGLPLRKIGYTPEGRCLSLEYEIENNLIVGQHVIGINGDTIRCPQWDAMHLCYYRMRFVRNFAGTIVSAKVINEFGEESMMTLQDLQYRISPLPGIEQMVRDMPVPGSQRMVTGVAIKEDILASPGHNVVRYVHITDTTATFYQSGVRDGDLLLAQQEANLRIARPHPEQNDFELKVLPCSIGPIGADIYPVWYTDAEMQRLMTSTKNQ